MFNGNAKKVVEFIEKELMLNNISYEKIILFGSSLNNSSYEDVDIAIISKMFISKSISERAIIMKEIERKAIHKFDIPIDIIKLTPSEYEEDGRLISADVKEGEVIYTADK